jgi:hypothetical protein
MAVAQLTAKAPRTPRKDGEKTKLSEQSDFDFLFLSWRSWRLGG